MIQIKCEGHAFERELSLILALFYEDPALAFVSEWDGAADTQIRLALATDSSGVVASGELDDKTTRLSRQVRREYVSRDEKAMRKTAKQALCYTLLLMLEQYTGIEQGWGF